MTYLLSLRTLALLVLSTAAFVSTAAQAGMIPGKQAREVCAEGDTGPVTAYGEFPNEKAAKKVVFEWNCMMMVDRKVPDAFEKYVDKNWCDHGHLITRGENRCGTYTEAMQMFSRMNSKPLTDTEIIEFPLMSSVNGEMVTMYGTGVDIFRVVNGKITDHWDASPAKAISFKDKPTDMADWIMGGMKGPMPGMPAPAAAQ